MLSIFVYENAAILLLAQITALLWISIERLVSRFELTSCEDRCYRVYLPDSIPLIASLRTRKRFVLLLVAFFSRWVFVLGESIRVSQLQPARPQTIVKLTTRFRHLICDTYKRPNLAVSLDMLSDTYQGIYYVYISLRREGGLITELPPIIRSPYRCVPGPPSK